jgi:photoactive yellow protein
MVDDESLFATIDPGRLDSADPDFIDSLPFGVVGLTASGNTEIYNDTLVRFAKLKRDSVIGQPFFLMAGVCMNNFLVAQRFEDEDNLDTIIDYVLTFRMRPTPVKLRMIRQPDLALRYLLIQA